MKKILMSVLLAISTLVNSQPQGMVDIEAQQRSNALIQAQQQENLMQQQFAQQQAAEKRMTCQSNYSVCMNGEIFLGEFDTGPFCRAFSQKKAGECAIDQGGVNGQCIANILLSQPGQCSNPRGNVGAVLASCGGVLNSVFQQCMQNPSAFMTRANYMQFCTATYNNCLGQ